LATQGTTKDGLAKARTGTLTLMFLTSSMDRRVLLQILAKAREGGALLSPEEYGEDEEADEYEEELEEGVDEVLKIMEAVEAEELEALGTEPMHRASSAGKEALFVSFNLKRWLLNSPRGQLRVGMPAAGEAIAALLCCWSATVIHGLAGGPRSLAELNELVEPLDFDVLEEHVKAMERNDQVEARIGPDGTTRYAVTKWLREALVPIAVAGRQEIHFPPPPDDVLPPDRLDVEAAFQLSLPLVALPRELSGTCRLSARLEDDSLAGVTARVEGGCVVSCESRLDEAAGTWAHGSVIEWLDTVVDPTTALLEVGGDARLAGALIEGLYESLFGLRVG
jgi:DNA-binding HxlR family transcriptional regulator